MFETLANVDKLLESNRFLTGDHLTLADIRLFTSLVRFDWAYHGQFKCNIKRLVEFPNLWNFARDIFNLYGIGETVDRQHIIGGYYCGAKMSKINPNGISAIGPDLDFSIPKERIQKFNAKLIADIEKEVMAPNESNGRV